MNKKTTLLCVLDGYGLNPNPKGNAVQAAKKPTLDRLSSDYPNSTLVTHGTRVGLPEGHMGNSEVGHLNIGAGRVVKQWLYLIGSEIKAGFLNRSSEMQKLLKDASGRIHLIGLYSSGGVHSDYDHLFALLDFLGKQKREIVLHIITDGRDTAPNAANNELGRLEKYLSDHPQIKVASLSGRYYVMDRDKRWERTEKAFRAIALAEAPQAKSARAALDQSYADGITDEFITPHVINPIPLAENDSLLFWNFRADRMRQIVSALTQSDFSGFVRPIKALKSALTFTQYDKTFSLPFLWAHHEIKNHLGEVIASNGMTQLRIAETEKYPHVTYFFNGGAETPIKGEERIMVPSPRDVATYDLKPEMSAHSVTEKVVASIFSGKFDLIVLNFANCDMVGHTGVMEAAVKAVETVDRCLGECLSALDKMGGQALIFADHGNAEQMIDYDTGHPHTAHTTFPVPVYLYGSNHRTAKLRSGGALCDVAPTILEIIGITCPSEMTGTSLLVAS